MTAQTRETLETLAEILRHGANKRIGAATFNALHGDWSKPHDAVAHIEHAIANDIANADNDDPFSSQSLIPVEVDEWHPIATNPPQPKDFMPTGEILVRRSRTALFPRGRFQVVRSYTLPRDATDWQHITPPR